MKKIVYMMRHGQTLFNARRKIQGWCDSPLTELGINQAKVAQNYFKVQGIQFTDAYASTSQRACDTLELITSMSYQRIKGLKEWNFGTLEGESEDLNPSLPYQDFFVSYGGEEEMEFRKRISSTMFDIAQLAKGDSILVVSHGAACAQFVRAWEHTSALRQNKRLSNCCILKFEYEDESFKLIEIMNHNFEEILC